MGAIPGLSVVGLRPPVAIGTYFELDAVSAVSGR